MIFATCKRDRLSPSNVTCFTNQFIIPHHTGNEAKAATYLQAFNDRKRAISELLWSEDEGAWFDYDIVEEDVVDQFYPSNIMPMWASCYDDTNDIQQQVLDYLKVSR